jgi:hypothetical protein
VKSREGDRAGDREDDRGDDRVGDDPGSGDVEANISAIEGLNSLAYLFGRDKVLLKLEVSAAVPTLVLLDSAGLSSAGVIDGAASGILFT